MAAAGLRESGDWYLKSLSISEQQGNLHIAASTHREIGFLEGSQGDMKLSAGWLTRAIRGLLDANDEHAAEIAAQNFFTLYIQASEPDKLAMKSIWEQANLGPFPTEPTE